MTASTAASLCSGARQGHGQAGNESSPRARTLARDARVSRTRAIRGSVALYVPINSIEVPTENLHERFSDPSHAGRQVPEEGFEAVDRVLPSLLPCPICSIAMRYRYFLKHS
jgi:hypothetical protein